MMPKSTTAIAPSASTNMLPGWRSAWKKPSRNTWLKKAAAALRSRSSIDARRRGAPPGRRRGSRLTRSSVKTVRPVRSQSTRGTRKLGSPAKFSASSAAAAASKRRSISNLTTSASVCTTSTGFSRRSAGCSRSAKSREPQEQVEVAGKRSGDARSQHLDRDLVPVGGPSEMDLRDRGGGDRRLVEGCEQTVERAGELGLDQRRAPQRPGNGGSRSCRLARSAAISSPRRSARVDSSWPSLMKLGPNSSNAAASRWPGRGDPAAAARKQVTKPHEGHCGRDGRQRRQRIVPREGQADPDQPRKIADAAQKPEPGSERLRAARPNGAQRRPPSDCGI